MKTPKEFYKSLSKGEMDKLFTIDGFTVDGTFDWFKFAKAYSEYVLAEADKKTKNG